MANCQALDAKREGYLAWHRKANRFERKGYKQKQCGECGLWLWPDEEKRCPDFSVCEAEPKE